MLSRTMYTNILQLLDYNLACKNAPHLKEELSSTIATCFSRRVTSNDYKRIDIVMISRQIVYNNKDSSKISNFFIVYTISLASCRRYVHSLLYCHDAASKEETIFHITFLLFASYY